MKDEVTVLICYGTSTISKLISLFTRSKITHTGFKVVLGGKVFVAESQNNGFQLKTYETWKEQFNYTFEEFEVPEIYQNVELNIYDHLSKVPYDFRLFVFRFPKHIISKIWGNKKKIDAVKNESKREICSESVSHCLGWDNPHTYLPIDVYNRVILENWNKR
jgi:hypothetical protein